MTGTEAVPVTVLGMGAMGRALAAAFLDRGRPTTVWNRSAGKTSALAASGASVAGQVIEAVTASPVVVACVLNDDAVRAVIGSAGDALAGRTLVNLTTGTPRQARDLAEWASAHEVEYLDGGIMAVPSLIGEARAFVLYSGSDAAFRRHQGLLGELGTARYLGLDAGLASLYDLALLSAMYGMFGGYFHAAALLGSESISAVEFTPLVVSWLQAMLPALPAMARSIDLGDHSADESSLGMQASGFANLLDASAAQRVSTELMAPIGRLLDRGVAAGFGSGGLSSLIQLL